MDLVLYFPGENGLVGKRSALTQTLTYEQQVSKSDKWRELHSHRLKSAVSKLRHRSLYSLHIFA